MKAAFFSFLLIVLVFGFFGCDNLGDKDFTVTFDLDGGNINGNTDQIKIVVKNGETIANLPEPQKQNFSFNGWFTSKNGLGNQFTNTTSVTSDLAVFAKWTSTTNFSIIGIWQSFVEQFNYIRISVADDMTFIADISPNGTDWGNNENSKGIVTVNGETITFTYTAVQVLDEDGQLYWDTSSEKMSEFGLSSNPIDVTIIANDKIEFGGITFTKQ
jgi:uncharacterized repeat protein (TIGR02543 family)